MNFPYSFHLRNLILQRYASMSKKGLPFPLKFLHFLEARLSFDISETRSNRSLQVLPAGATNDPRQFHNSRTQNVRSRVDRWILPLSKCSATHGCNFCGQESLNCSLCCPSSTRNLVRQKCIILLLEQD